MYSFLQSVKWVSTGLMLISVMLTAAPAQADSGYYLIPWLTLSEKYDDNLFYDTEDPVSGFISTISPSLELGYESETLNWITRYAQDAEYYHQEPDLNSSHARQRASGEFEYKPDDRWVLAGEAGFTKSNTPADLTLFPGGDIPVLQLERVPAEWTYIRPAVAYQFSPNKNGSLVYSWTDSELIGVTKTYTQAVEANLEHQLSQINLVTYGYLYRHYRFVDESGDANFTDTSTSSNTPWVGLTHEFSRSTEVSARAGPLFSNGSTSAYLQLSFQHSYARGVFQANYTRDKTSQLGEEGLLNSQSLGVSATRKLNTDVEVSVTADLTDASKTGFSTKTASVALEGSYKLNSYTFIFASYRYISQKSKLIGGDQDRVTQGEFLLGVTFTRPRAYN